MCQYPGMLCYILWIGLQKRIFDACRLSLHNSTSSHCHCTNTNAVYINSHFVCLSVCFSHSCIVSKRPNVSSNYLPPHHSSVLKTNIAAKFWRGSPFPVSLNTGEVWKRREFQPISGYIYISEPTQDTYTLVQNINIGNRNVERCHC